MEDHVGEAGRGGGGTGKPWCPPLARITPNRHNGHDASATRPSKRGSSTAWTSVTDPSLMPRRGIVAQPHHVARSSRRAGEAQPIAAGGRSTTVHGRVERSEDRHPRLAVLPLQLSEIPEGLGRPPRRALSSAKTALRRRRQCGSWVRAGRLYRNATRQVNVVARRREAPQWSAGSCSKCRTRYRRAQATWRR